mmetsp:Transcript_3573/g.7723  ORF Transcript_3573/g.7723 Transcript_3573/m.7723 type:complete len:86 (-) Transcript_3573:1081-1338(-)
MVRKGRLHFSSRGLNHKGNLSHKFSYSSTKSFHATSSSSSERASERARSIDFVIGVGVVVQTQIITVNKHNFFSYVTFAATRHRE